MAVSDYLPRRRILLTGASGFVGGFLVDALLAYGIPPDSLFLLSRKLAPELGRGLQFVTGDITDRARISAIVGELQPEAVIHLAAIAEPALAQNAPDLAWRINFESVRFLAEAILSASPNTRLLFSGSAEAYGASGNTADGPIRERTVLQPVSTYGATKAAADILLGQLAWQGLRAVRFRAFNHTGPGQSPKYVVSSFAEQIARIDAGLIPPVLRVGNLKAQRDFLDVRDVVRAYVLALEADFDFGAAPVLNISSGVARPIGEILEQLLAMAKRPIEIEVDAARLRPSEVATVCGDNSEARRALGWHPAIDFDTTLSDTLSWWRKRV